MAISFTCLWHNSVLIFITAIVKQQIYKPCDHIYIYMFILLNTNRIVIPERRSLNWNIAVEGTLYCTVNPLNTELNPMCQ